MPDIELIDTHCHLCHGRLKTDLAGVMARAVEAGVAAIVCATGELDEAAAAAKLPDKKTTGWPAVYFTVGLHPHEAKTAEAGYLDRLAEFAAGERCVAIGEIGLDYHYNFSEPATQRKVFAEQIAMAVATSRPVVIHTREAFADTLAIIRNSGIDGRRIVFHSFTEPPDAAAQAIELGAYISFSGIVTFKNSDLLRRSAMLTPDDRIMIETDSPYLSPEPVRKMKTNEPANVAHVAAHLAGLRKQSPEQFAHLTTENAKRFFHLALPA